MATIMLDETTTIVHILDAGYPLCGFDRGVPRDWPANHRWVTMDDRTPLDQLGNVGPNPERCAGCEEARAKFKANDPVFSRHAR